MFLLGNLIAVPSYNTGKELAALSRAEQAKTTFMLTNAQAAMGVQVQLALKQQDYAVQVQFATTDPNQRARTIDKARDEVATDAELALISEGDVFLAVSTLTDATGNITDVHYVQKNLRK